MCEKFCFTTLGLFLVTCLTSGCTIAIGETIHGSGERIVQQRSIDDFQEIEVSGAITVKVYCGEEPSLEISGDDNIVERVISELADGRLELQLQSGSYSMEEPLEITVTCSELNEVDVSGACNVSVEAIESEEFTVDASGASKVTLEGSTTRLIVDISGATKVTATELAADQVHVDASGAAKATVNAAESIHGDLSGAAKLEYTGKPPQEDISSSGAASHKAIDTVDAQAEA